MRKTQVGTLRLLPYEASIGQRNMECDLKGAMCAFIEAENYFHA